MASVATAPGGNASDASPRGTGILTGSHQGGLRASTIRQETLYTLASDTGGKALLDTNDLTLGIRQAQEDIHSYYTLGYYPRNAEPDGKYRRSKSSLSTKTRSISEARLPQRILRLEDLPEIHRIR